MGLVSFRWCVGEVDRYQVSLPLPGSDPVDLLRKSILSFRLPFAWNTKDLHDVYLWKSTILERKFTNPMILASDSNLPNSNPPIVELALSILFEPIVSLNDVHLGPFWWENKGSFPTVEPVQPIRFNAESFAFGKPFSDKNLTIELLGEPETRLMMSSADGDWLCQLQRDRMVINWRKVNSEYPRYPAVRSKLESMWSSWCDFVLKVVGSAPVATKWELIYVNKVTPTKENIGWEKVLPGLFHAELKQPTGGRLVGRRCQWIWDIESMNTRLVVDSAPAKQVPDDSVILSFTARGELTSSKEVWESLDDAHELVVSFFRSVVSSDILFQCKES